jgi:O-antigen/teichoic acid export membrane protein
MRERAFINASSNIIGTVVTLAVWFGVTTVILHHLNLATFGLWTLSTTLTGYLPLLDLGIGDALTRNVAAARARGEIVEVNRWVASGFRVFLVLGVLTLALTALVAPVFADVFHVPVAERGLAAPVVALSGLGAALAFPSITTLAILQGLHRFELVNIVGTASALITGTATVIVMWTGGNVVELVAVGVPMQVLSQIPMILFIRRAAPEIKLRLPLADRESTRALLSFGGAQALVRGARQLRWYCDEIVIGLISSVRLVAPYSTVRRLTEPAVNLSDQLLDTLLPLAADLNARGDRARMRDLLIVGTRAALGTFLLTGVSVALLAEPFVRYWAGARYVTHSSIAPLLIATGMLWAAMAPAENLLAGMARLRLPVIAGVVSAVSKLALAVGLGLAFGIVGVAVSGVLAGVINTAPVVVRGVHAADVSPRTMVRDSLAPPCVAAIAAVGAVLGSRAILGDGSLPIVMFDGAMGSLAFAAVYMSMPPAALEREVVTRLLGPLWARRRLQSTAAGSGDKGS